MRSIPLLSAGVLALAALVGCSVVGPAAPTPPGSNASTTQQSAVQPSSPPLPTVAPTGQGESGVAGRTMVDGGCPVEYEGSPCPEKPLSARITILLAGTSSVVTVVISDAEGHFRVGLPPGTYVLNAANRSGAPYPRSNPVEVVVQAGRYTTVTVSFDSGIQ